MEGKVVWYSEEKKMGLIKDLKTGNVHVVHKSQIESKGLSNLKVGKNIKFQLGSFPGFVDEVKISK